MPIYIHLANLIIPKKVIASKYDGGIEGFRTDFNIGEDNYNQEDSMLFSISKMNVDEFYIEFLVQKGLHFDIENQFSTDFVILVRYGSYLWDTPYIQDNTIFAWHIDSPQSSIDKAIAIGNQSIESIEKQFEKGENPFATIW